MSASRIGLRLFARPLHLMLSLLERIAGVGFLDDLSEFLSAIDGLSQGFRDRATRVEDVLLGKDTGFVLISAGSEGSSQSTLEFMAELDQFRVPLIAVIANRMRPWPLAISPAELLRGCTDDSLKRDEERLSAAFLDQSGAERTAQDGASRDFHRVTRAILEYARVCETEQQTLDSLTANLVRTRLRCLSVPELAGDIDRIEGLLEIGSILRAGSGRPASGDSS
jgi:anion-transporting  ArsA/GET3 family ATPase